MEIQVKTKTRPALGLAIAALAVVSIGFFIGAASFITQQSSRFFHIVSAPCSVLTEKQCRDNIIRCQPVFDAGAEFTSCKALDESQALARRAEKEQCVQSGGAYIAERYGPYCNCAVSEKRYVVGYGCQ